MLVYMLAISFLQLRVPRHGLRMLVHIMMPHGVPWATRCQRRRSSHFLYPHALPAKSCTLATPRHDLQRRRRRASKGVPQAFFRPCSEQGSEARLRG